MFRLPDVFTESIRDAQGRGEKVYEPVVGIVIDNVDPLKMARIKVSVKSLPGTDQSFWAHMSGLGAGQQRGWFFLPEVDDEVLVMFEHGDIRRPIIIGAVWNGVDAPPESNPGANPKRAFVSRENSRIVFDDEEME
ncbi:MAG: phage baseplate assembly protein V, partial [Deltaproteobacteria bacterium]|nr:phage baseplate assembly protein V [Deltaproteobacteria bacterium]